MLHGRQIDLHARRLANAQAAGVERHFLESDARARGAERLGGGRFVATAGLAESPRIDERRNCWVEGATRVGGKRKRVAERFEQLARNRLPVTARGSVERAHLRGVVPSADAMEDRVHARLNAALNLGEVAGRRRAQLHRPLRAEPFAVQNRRLRRRRAGAEKCAGPRSREARRARAPRIAGCRKPGSLSARPAPRESARHNPSGAPDSRPSITAATAQTSRHSSRGGSWPASRSSCRPGCRPAASTCPAWSRSW